MPKAFTLGNGHMLIGLDQVGQVYDFYYPHVGLENHTAGSLVHKIGVFADGSISWIDDGSWEVDVTCPGESMSSRIVAINRQKHIELQLDDVVYNEKTIFIRKIRIKNLLTTRRTIKLFMNHQFEIYESHRGDTALYDPRRKALVHYKGRRVFLINAEHKDIGIKDYSVGLLGIEGREGTFKDAEDGQLAQNTIEHGFCDSVAGFTFDLEGETEETFHYWVCVGKGLQEAQELNMYVIEKTPAYLINTTQSFWNAWVNKQNFSFYKLEPDIIQLFKQSLLIIRAHVDHNGGIIASGDSDLLKQGRDYYNYMWPRDGAFITLALSKTGYTHVSKKFFRFAESLLTERGYLMHKYRPDGSFGASWHSWVQDHKDYFPIQEDETALVIFALWQFYLNSKDLEFIEEMYNPLIKKAAEFMITYIDPETGLPLPSFDLWEEKYGTTTFTCAAVYAGLTAASKFAGLLGKKESEQKYQTFAEGIKTAMLEHLYDPDQKYFYKSVYKNGTTYEIDRTFDMSSIYALYEFDILEITDERLVSSIEKVHNELTCKTEIGGVARYVDDYYFRVSYDVPGNPWIITTLWLAQYYIRKAKTEADFEPAIKLLHWAKDRALKSGVLSEQMNPYTGEQLSASPLVWSHAEFVSTVIMYLEKVNELGICEVCLPIE